MSKVYVKFPKTGLGNLLLIWARAYVFSEINHLPLVTSSWWAFRWGAWLRNEKKKRLYWGYFRENGFLRRLGIQWFRLTHKIVHEPPIQKIDTRVSGNQLFLFDRVIVDNDLFGSIRDYSDLISQKLYEMLNPKLKKQLETYVPPVISIHIRRGDFKMGNPITPESFFIKTINEIRKAANEDLPVTVFTDANEDEIMEVLALPETHMASPKADILDILLMSKSKFVILSRSSTFSYWAAFLSDALVIRPAGDWQLKIKDKLPGNNYKELIFPVNSLKLKSEMKLQ
jgi:hypothetical protein